MSAKYAMGWVPQVRTNSRRRWLSTGILTVLVLGMFTVADAAKGGNPGKPGDTDPPDPPPVVEEGVIYALLRGGWGSGPQEFWQMDANGENWQLLFESDPTSILHKYQWVAPSEHTYGPYNSRYFACGLDYILPGSPYVQYNEVGGPSIVTHLVIIDQWNNEVIDVLAGSNLAMDTFGIPFTWYGDDTKLAIPARKFNIVGTIPADLNPGEEPDGYWVESDWDTLGIYTIDLSIDASGAVTAGPPLLVNWTHEHLVSPPKPQYYEDLPFMPISNFVIEERAGAPDRIYFSMEVDPGNYIDQDTDLYRAEFADADFSGQLEFLNELGMRSLMLDPTNTILSGQIHDGVDKIVYHFLETGTSLVIPPEGGTDTSWESPLWSPSGNHVIFRYVEFSGSHAAKRSGFNRATWDFQDVTEIYRTTKSMQEEFLGWRSLP